MRSRICTLFVSAVAMVLLAVPGHAAAALTATAITIADHPGRVQVALQFQGAALLDGQVEATDPKPFDGAAAVRVFRAGVVSAAADRSGSGVSVRNAQRAGELIVRMTAARQRFKYLSYSVRSRRLLAIDLWKSGPPVKAAEIVRGRGGCLTLERFRVNTGMASASGGRQTQPEPRFAVIVRGADGNLLGRVVKTRSGAWTARVTYRTPRRQPGTLEASAASPKDGSLACLVQRRVWLPATVGGVVRSFRWGIDELGFWHIGGRGHGTYPAAVAALGSPSDLRQRGNGSCVAGWPGLGLRIRFTTFGAASGCESLFAQEGTISGVAGRSRWRTTRGLRVGDSVARLDRAYPHAIRLPAARVLEWASPSPYGTGRLDLITATLARGHVTSLRLFIGASGD